MIVVIANKLKDVIEKSELTQLEHKIANGVFSSSDCVRTLEKMNFDYLILDVTAIKNCYEISAWKEFKNFFDPTRTLILLEETKSQSNYSFLSMLITMGYYNFAKTAEDLFQLMKTPNTYEMVSKYQQMAMAMKDKKENAAIKIGDYERGIAEKQDMMQDYMKRYQEGEFDEAKIPKSFGYQIKVGLLVLPFLTILSTMIFYLLESWLGQVIKLDSNLGKNLFQDYYGIGLNPITLLGLFIALLLFAFYYTHLTSEIKRRQMTNGKFIILPFAIYTFLFIGEYHLLGSFEKLYDYLLILPNGKNPYINVDLYGFARMCAMVAIILFYFKILVSNSKVLKFEKDLSQNLTFLEKLWGVIETLLLGLPILYHFAHMKMAGTYVDQIFSKIYQEPMLMKALAAIELLLMVIILIFTKFKKEKKYKVLREEDL